MNAPTIDDIIEYVAASGTRLIWYSTLYREFVRTDAVGRPSRRDHDVVARAIDTLKRDARFRAEESFVRFIGGGM